MGTTINGVYEGGKRMRRIRALRRLEVDLKYYTTLKEKSIEDGFPTVVTNTHYQIQRINKEIEILKSRI